MENLQKINKLTLPLSYKGILTSDLHYFLLYGGRLGGKTDNIARIVIKDLVNTPDTDVIVARVSYGSMADSSYAEFVSVISELNMLDKFIFKKSPLRIETTDGRNTIYFIGYGGSNFSRTKSFVSRHPIRSVILEETQELKDKRSFDEAMASFRRHFGEDIKVYVLGNVPPQEAHWFNVFIKEKQQDKDWLCKKVSYLDIINYINDFDLKEICKAKLYDENYYNWFYMGIPNGMGGVYPMFRKNKHIITSQQFAYALEQKGIQIMALVIGVDGAVNRDSTCFCPIALLNNGQSAVLPIFYHNPKEDAVIGYHSLVQGYVGKWFEEICQQYHLGSLRERLMGVRQNYVPMFMRIDSGAPDLVQECKFYFGDRVDVAPIHKKTIFEMVGVGQSAISNDFVVIVDYGGTYDYYQNRFIKGENKLAEQLSMLEWNEKQNGYDNIIPNDVCDAWTYGNLFWYGNQENIQYLNIIKSNTIQNNLLSVIIKQ